MKIGKNSLILCGALRAPHRWLITKFLLWSSAPAIVRGFEVHSLSRPLSNDHRLALEAALDLIVSTDRTRYVRLQHDVRRIILVHSGGAEYWPMADGFILTDAYVTRAKPEDLALTIVHEAIHARMFSMGVGYPTELRARIEFLAVSQEALFARRLPNGEELAEQVCEKLSHPWWTPEEISARQQLALQDGNFEVQTQIPIPPPIKP